MAVDFVAVYERRPPAWTTEFTARAQQGLLDGSRWLFSSSEAVMHLRNKFNPAHLASAHALATHERIATAARQAGFGHVKSCRPALEDIIASVESTP